MNKISIIFSLILINSFLYSSDKYQVKNLQQLRLEQLRTICLASKKIKTNAWSLEDQLKEIIAREQELVDTDTILNQDQINEIIHQQGMIYDMTTKIKKNDIAALFLACGILEIGPGGELNKEIQSRGGIKTARKQLNSNAYFEQS